MMVDRKQVRTHANKALTIINVSIHSAVTGVLLCPPLPVVAIIIHVPVAIHFTINHVEPLVSWAGCGSPLHPNPPEPPVVPPSGHSSWFCGPSMSSCGQPSFGLTHLLRIQSAPKYHTWSCQHVPTRSKNVLGMANCAWHFNAWLGIISSSISGPQASSTFGNPFLLNTLSTWVSSLVSIS